MALHCAEQIMAAFTAALADLFTTGDNVWRGRAYPAEADIEAGLCVYQGQEAVSIQNNWINVNCALGVYVDIIVKTVDEDIDTLVNRVRAEVTAALTASNPPLGLSFVRSLEEVGTGDIDPDGIGEKPTAKVRTEWQVQYRRSRTDPTSGA